MKENVFGLPVEVQSRDEAAQMAAAEPTLYACMRCTDMPRHQIPEPVRSRNQIGWCVTCKASVWIDPLSYVPGTFPTCSHCLPAKFDAHTLRETVDQVRDLFPDAPFHQARPVDGDIEFRDET